MLVDSKIHRFTTPRDSYANQSRGRTMLAVDAGIATPFSRVVIINLRTRIDRLGAIQQELTEKQWPFGQPEVFEAILGDRMPVPSSFTQGAGAFGCRQSHLSVLQKAISDGISDVLILEDDVVLCHDFVRRVKAFLCNVPSDWEGLMFGGQHHSEPIQVKPGVVRCTNCHRTHAYACRGTYMRELFLRWLDCGVHIDWVMKDWQHQFRVYAPERFLIGQRHDQSNINGRTNPTNFWNPPEPSGSTMPVVWLDAPRHVVAELRNHGLHTGFQRDPVTDIDVGLRDLMSKERSQDEVIVELGKWIDMIQWECSNENETGRSRLICSVWHPKITADMVRQATGGFVYGISAQSVDSALAKLSLHTDASQAATSIAEMAI